jgi:lipopolysaccharide export system protein LptA
MRFLILLLLFFIAFAKINAQSIAACDTIKLVNAVSLIGIQKAGVPYNTLVGSVVLDQKGTVLTCDSAHLFIETNFVEAFGHVHIVTNNNATVESDYMRYNGNTHLAFLKGSVQIIDGLNTLHSEDLTYNITTKVATFNNGATLQSDNTTVVSNTGTYNGKTKVAYFKGDVLVTDPKFEIVSKEMKYNTDKKITTFMDESTITIDSTIIYGKKGTYDSKKEEGVFNTRSSVSNNDQEIIANHLYYNKKTGNQTANGNVEIFDKKDNRRMLCEKVFYNDKTTLMNAEQNVEIDEYNDGRVVYAQNVQYNKRNKYMLARTKVLIFDSAQNTILSCQKIEYNLGKNYTLATGKPLIRTLIDKDSMYIRADSFFSAPSNVIDTIKNKIITSNIVADSTKEIDTKIKRTLLALGHVKMYSDSMQAQCDSMTYSQADSVFRLFKAPILWTGESQATGDTIYIITQNNKAKQLEIMVNALIVSYTKDATLYDQISGTHITGFMKNDALDEMFVDGNAESIYYNKNEKGEYLGQNKSKCAQLRIKMKEKKISRIAFYSEPEGDFIPLTGMADKDKFLPNYVWKENLKIKNKEEIIGDK